MYISSIQIQNLKLLRDFQLDFGPPESPRMWTVLIGENGLCKTSILRAIAMAAVGANWSNKLADVPSLLDRRRKDSKDHSLNISGTFKYPSRGISMHEDLHTATATSTVKVSLAQEGPFLSQESLRVPSIVAGSDLTQAMPFADESRAVVVGYGIQRKLPSNPLQFELTEPAVQTRLASLFEKGQVIGTNFSKVFDQELSKTFETTVKKALIETEGLLPPACDLRLPGRNWAKDYNDIIYESSVVTLEIGAEKVDLPAMWLSPGYQSIIALISDIIGHFFARHSDFVDPKEMEGLILIDELDLHLHPRWQMGLIPRLKTLFPKLQFVVTTHSPLILAGAKREEIVVLTQDEEGNVVNG